MAGVLNHDTWHAWTRHVQQKMAQYRISPLLIKRIIRAPQRIEEGIAEKTIAVMQAAGRGRRKHEVWVMYQKKDAVALIISAWRYPGASPLGKPPCIPEDALKALADNQV